jgi:ferritin
MDKKLNDAFNTQIKNELASAYLYLSMAAYCDSLSLEGFGNWFKVQAKEEVGHAMKMYEFLNDRGVTISLEALPKPDADFASPKEAFEKTLVHEKKVTALINSLYETAQKLDDKAACIFLQWFITEQVEEEKNAMAIIDKLKMIKPDSAALLMFDSVLAKRGAE